MAARRTGWTRLRSRRLHRSTHCGLRRDRLRAPSGHEFDHLVVEIPTAVAVVPRRDDGSIVLLRQFRPAVGEPIWEIPGGRIHPGETPRAAARRELREEAGCVARRLRRGPEFLPLVGLSPHRVHGFVASDLRPVPREPEPTEEIRVRTFAIHEVRRMIERGRIRDAFSLVLLQHVLLGDAAGGRAGTAGRTRRIR